MKKSPCGDCDRYKEEFPKCIKSCEILSKIQKMNTVLNPIPFNNEPLDEDEEYKIPIR